MDSKFSYAYNGDIQLRSLEGVETPKDSRIVCGYAVRFDVDSQNLGFIERIEKGAITEETIMNSDIYARLNHDESTVLARSRYGEGTLALELRDDGLYYEFEAPHTAAGDELLEHIRRGEITTSSFAFTLAKEEGAEKWYREGDVLKRNIRKIGRLYDVSPVYEAAYLSTSCTKRSAEIMDESTRINTMYDDIMREIENYKI